MSDRFKFSGAMPANLLPFNEDYSFDVPNYRRHLSWLADVKGVPAIVCNGHASEVSSLTQDERQKALAEQNLPAQSISSPPPRKSLMPM